MGKVQFRVLYREFLFRIVDIEVLSAHAQGDSNKLLGQFAALLIFVSILLSMPSLGAGDSHTPPGLRLFYAWSAEHFLIATTMLVVGLFAVLSWDSTFPDRRDVLVLAPLPVRTRTLFLAKVAAAATALSLTVALLHSLAGLVWPVALGSQGSVGMSVPALGFQPAMPPVDSAGIGSLLQREMAPFMPHEMGVAIGVVKHGDGRVFTFGKARPDSIYQIASISKTFTGLVLAQMVDEGKVRLDQPIRELLPPGTVRKPVGREITLVDLATHRSGLPTMPDNSDADYQVRDLYAFIARHGVARPPNPSFSYSNVGYALLGQTLADREGVTYPELIARRITGPLGMRDTAVELSPDQMRRVIPAYSVLHELRPLWEVGALAPAGGICSTAGDMLAYLEAQLAQDSAALRLSHQPRAQLARGIRIALAWAYDEDTGTWWHNGAISAYTSHALFNPRSGYAVVVLVNQALSLETFADLVAEHIRERLTGAPAVSLASVTVPSSGGITAIARTFAVYWLVMFLAGAFMYCAVLALQGVAAELLPRRVFLRVSSWLQLAAFCGVVCGYLLQPMFAAGRSLVEATGSGVLGWSPSYWFLGLFQQLNGSPALGVLARRAWIGLAVILCATAVVYALSYLRTLRRIAEEPDIVAGGRGGVWLPRFHNALETAIVQFTARTLMRSRRHRLILAFYLGIGFAFLILLVKAPAVRSQVEDSPGLAASIAMLGFAVIGTRVVFSMPIDLRANWVFQITGVRRAAECLRASRRSLILLAVVPVWTASAVSRPAAAHLAMLAGLGLLLTELCLHRFHKIPFTCSWLPGKSQMNLSVLGGIALLWFLVLSIRFERRVLDHGGIAAAIVAALLLAAACLRWANRADAEVDFEDVPEPAVRELGLNRDGYCPVSKERAALVR